MAQIIRLEIPNYLPPRELSPNARVHWRMRFDAQHRLKDEVFVAMAQKRIVPYDSLRTASITRDGSSGRPVLFFPFPWDAIEVKLIFYVKDARRRDMDNYIASMKSGLDQLQGYIIRDDRNIKSIEVEFVKDKAKAPMTVIEVSRII